MAGKKMANGLRPAVPLWRRAPTKDQQGRSVSDFMMLIPRLSKQPELYRRQVLGELQSIFRQFGQQVHFADLNLQLNLLWISVESSPGLIGQLATEIRRRVPQALLIGHECGVGMPLEKAGGWRQAVRFKDHLLRLCGRRRALARPDSAPH
jgi:hypothetical protein